MSSLSADNDNYREVEANHLEDADVEAEAEPRGAAEAEGGGGEEGEERRN